MGDWLGVAIEHLWRNGIAAVPLVAVAAVATRILPCRPATRHTMWVMVLVWLLLPPLLPQWTSPTTSRDAIVDASKATETTTSNRESLADRTLQDLNDVGDAKNMARGNDSTAPELIQRNQPTNGLIEGPDATSKKIATKRRLPRTPSPRLAAQAATRSPDMLARVSDGAAGPLSNLDDNGSLPGIHAEKMQSLRNSRSLSRDSQESEANLPTARSDRAQDLAAGVDLRESARLLPFTSIAPRPSRIHHPRIEPQIFDSASTAGVVSHSDAEIVQKVEDSRKSARTNWELLGSLVATAGSYIAVQIRVAGEFSRMILLPRVAAGWSEWASAWIGVRDSVGAIPPLPTNVWFGGAAILLLIAAIRVLRFQRCVRAARPAPPSVLRLVRHAARRIGLSDPPETLMLDRRVSPMISCGIRPRLILPTHLWRELDDLGRCTVLLHELAHLRRRDHWVTWAESLIGSLYWWHPIVWWVRHRLQTEAEVCCDAWVTSLLPRTRRAYAEALLKTKVYLGNDSHAAPGLGIGVTTGRARRFARRLTMVMTESVKPRLSLPGVALVLCVATAGWIATPARSCPNEAKASSSTPRAEATSAAPCATAKAESSAPCAKASGGGAAVALPCPEAKAGSAVPTPRPANAPRVEAIPRAISVLPAIAVQPIPQVRLVGSKNGDDDEDDDDNNGQADRLQRLERELHRLGEQLERLEETMNGGHRSHGEGHGRGEAKRRVEGHMAPPAPPTPPIPPSPPEAGHVFVPATPIPPIPPMPPMAGHGPGHKGGKNPWNFDFNFDFPDGNDGEKEFRPYKLSGGKLEALTALMSRPDVPVLVRPKGDAIEIQATPRQHRVIEAFIRMIDPKGEGRGEPGSPKADASQKRAIELAERYAVRAREVSKEQQKAMQMRLKEIEKAQKQRERLNKKLEDARSQIEQRTHSSEELQQQSERIIEQADQLKEQAEEIRGQVEETNRRADEADNADSRMEIQRQALTLNHHADELELQARQLEEKARSIEDKAHQAEDRAREAEERMRESENEIHGLESSLADMQKSEVAEENEEEDDAADDSGNGTHNDDADDDDDDDAKADATPSDASTIIDAAKADELAREANRAGNDEAPPVNLDLAKALQDAVKSIEKK